MKKYLLFIVEGQNDKKEIQAMLRSYYPNEMNELYEDAYKINNGDITSNRLNNEKNIVKVLTDLVIRWRNGEGDPNQKILTSDIKQIIHIVDLDGTFIPEESIIESDAGKIKYTDNSIECMTRSDVVGRNRKKGSIIRRLSAIHQIDNIPYTIFFASRNMDHVLFDAPDSSQREKSDNAWKFIAACKKNSDIIADTIFKEGIGTDKDYAESWEEIQCDFKSLQRHTNLNIMLQSIMNDSQ